MPLSVFLVEDDPVIRDMIGAMLVEVLDASVAGVAETSDEALQWLAEHDGQWNLVVLDLFLKQGTGFMVLSHMTPAHRRQCVVLTNSATPVNVARCISLGVVAIFDKTLQIGEFLAYCTQLPAVQSTF